MSSSASVNTANVELSPMRVTFNSVDLGGTSGGAKVGIKHDYSSITVDQFGKTEVDAVLSGQAYSVKLVLAETKLKDNWKVAFPSMKLVTSAGNKMMYFDSQIGDHLLDRSAVLLLHPLSKDDNDLAGDFKFFKAVAKSAVEVEYGADKQTGLEVEFMVFPDTGSSPARFFIHGDPSIGLVAASAGAPAAGANTGNGTCTSASAGSATITETITITCVGIPASNKSNWVISGGTSGVIGELQLTGSAGGTGVFTSNKVNFTITDGSSDFVITDSFTIAMTAANYA